MSAVTESRPWTATGLPVAEAGRIAGPAHASRGETVPIGRIPAPAPVSRAWAFGAGTGAGVRVCLIDSGVDDRHPALAGSVPAYRLDDGEHGGYDVVPDDAGDVAGHGTACAGIIRSLAPGCELVSVRLLGRTMRARGDALVAALQWAVDEQFHLVNLSLSTRSPDYWEAVRDITDRAYFEGTTIVAAAHNRPVVSAPWCFPSVLSAGSHTRPDPEYLEVNPAPPVEFFGHGVNVTVARPGGGRARVSGNSFAAPHVTGMCARILGAHLEFSAAAVRVVLAAVANNIEPDNLDLGAGHE
jgi:subtilisin family serine protease